MFSFLSSSVEFLQGVGDIYTIYKIVPLPESVYGVGEGWCQECLNQIQRKNVCVRTHNERSILFLYFFEKYQWSMSFHDSRSSSLGEWRWGRWLSFSQLMYKGPGLKSYPVPTPPFGGIVVLRTEHVLPMHYLLKVRYYFSVK